MSLICLVAMTLRSPARYFHRRIRLALSRDARYAEIEPGEENRGRIIVPWPSSHFASRQFPPLLSQSASNCLNSLLGDSIFTGNPYYFSVISSAHRKTFYVNIQLRVGVTLFARCCSAFPRRLHGGTVYVAVKLVSKTVNKHERIERSSST